MLAKANRNAGWSEPRFTNRCLMPASSRVCSMAAAPETFSDASLIFVMDAIRSRNACVEVVKINQTILRRIDSVWLEIYKLKEYEALYITHHFFSNSFICGSRAPFVSPRLLRWSAGKRTTTRKPGDFEIRLGKPLGQPGRVHASAASLHISATPSWAPIMVRALWWGIYALTSVNFRSSAQKHMIW